MQEMYREEVMNKFASDDVDVLDIGDLASTLRDIYINGMDTDWPPYINWTDEELEDEWLERYDNEICIVDVKTEDGVYLDNAEENNEE